MEGCGLSIAQFGLLAQVAAAADDTLGALAERTGLDQSTLSRNLRGLDAAGSSRSRLPKGISAAAPYDSPRRGQGGWKAALPVWRAAHARLTEKMSPAAAHASPS
jgi:hypothetical protein